jgi:hypothetical protein
MHRLPAPALAIVVMLLFGFARSGLATARLYRELFDTPPVRGPEATIDAYLRPLTLASGDELRRAVKRAHWGDKADVSIVVEAAIFSARERSQLHLAASYALYPASVFLRSPEDVMAVRSAGKTQRVIVAGPSNPFPGAAVEEVSSVLRLVSLP